MNSGLREWRAAGTAVFFFCLFMALATLGPAAVVTRGPYLQQGTSNSIVIRWRTDVATSSAVGYGVSSGNFTGAVNDAAAVTNHIVSVSNLDARTKYFYRIGTATSWFTTNTNNFFITAPAIGTIQPIRIWALGDSGTANADAFAVRDAYTAFNGPRPTDVLLMLGDNAYDAGTDAEYQAAVFNTYPTYLRNTVLWPTIGNHDQATGNASPYLDIFTLPQNGQAGGVASGTERYYSFDYANVHFLCLDSASSARTTNGAMFTWARADLQATAQEWIIAFWHHPPYSKGSHNSDTESGLVEMRQNFNPLLEEYGVDLVLCGHSHGYERSFFLDGHYGNSITLTAAMKKDGGDGREDGNGVYQKEGDNIPHQGTVYTVAGSSGQTSSGSYNHPAMYTSMEVLGSAVIDVLSNRLDLTFLQDDATVGDYFTIIKAPPSTNLPSGPTNLIATAIATNRITLSWTDSATNEQGFKMERSTNGVDFAQFGTVGAGVTNATNSGLLPNRTYHFRVRAYNVAGDSAYSDIAQATTFAMPVPDTTPPAAITNLIVSAVTSNSATLSWTAPGDDGNNGTATSYDVRYRTNAITSNNWASSTLATGEPVPLLAGTTQSFTINGLVANRTYFFGIRTSDEVTNISQLSIIATVTTPPVFNGDATPPAAVTNLAVSAVTSNSVTLSWRAPGDDGNIGTAAGYDVRYRTNAITSNNWATSTLATNEPAPTPAGTTQFFIVDGLTPARTYFFAIRTSDETNNISPLSNVATGTTPPVSPPDTNAPAAVTNLIVSAITSNTVTLTWTAPGDDGTNGTAASYDVRYRTNAITSNNWASSTLATNEPAPLPAGTTQSFSINGLAPNRTYFFAIRSSDETNNISQLSNIASGTTPPVVPPDTNAPAAITDLLASVVSATTVTLSWTSPGDDGTNGTAASYDVRYRTNAITSNNWASSTLATGEPVPLLAGTTQSFNINGLTPDRTYYFAVRASDETNNIGQLSNVATGTTPAVPPPDTNAPAAITNLIVSVITSNTVTLTWTAPGDDGTNGTAASYDVRYRTNAITSNNWASSTLATNEPAPLLTGTTQSFSINGLAPNRTYFFAIRSSDETNNISQLSNIASGTTPPVVPPDTNAPAAITDLLASVVSATTVTLSWTSPGDDGTNGTAASYDVRYRTNAITSNNWASSTLATGEPVPLLAGTTQSFNINGLTPDRTYYFAVRASDETNNISQLSNVATGTTPAVPPSDTNAPAAVTNLLVGIVTSNTVMLSWTAPGDDGTNGTAASYDVRWRTNFITSANWTSSISVTGGPLPAIAGTLQSMTITGLVPSRPYYFALRTSDEATNVSPLSNVPDATTLAATSAGLGVVTLIPSNSVWKYRDDGSNQGTAWAGRGFNDTVWTNGPATLGYGGGEATVVSYGPSSGNKYITTYFRRHFNVGDPSVLSVLNMALLRDDGVLVYLNGNEVFRTNMTNGPVNYLTRADSNISGTNRTIFYPSPTIPATHLVAGDNVVAAEVHTWGPTAAAMSFNLELKGTLGPPITQISKTSPEQFVLRWQSYPGKSYRVFYADVLPAVGWTNAGSDIFATGFSSATTNVVTANQQRFFRVQLLD